VRLVCVERRETGKICILLEASFLAPCSSTGFRTSVVSSPEKPTKSKRLRMAQAQSMRYIAVPYRRDHPHRSPNLIHRHTFSRKPVRITRNTYVDGEQLPDRHTSGMTDDIFSFLFL
jgi:hypothetical protein